MKLILRSDVQDLGRIGDLVDVKDGYARNFLLPRKLAVPATPGNLKDYQKRIAEAKAREERERAAANAVAGQIKAQKLVLVRRAVEGGNRIHGSVTSAEVAEELSKLIGQEISRKDVDLKNPIRTLGEHQVTVRLMRGVSAILPVTVTDKDPAEAAAEAAAAKAAAEAAEAAQAEAAAE